VLDVDEREQIDQVELITAREREIIRHVVFGMRNAEVAAALRISVSTVKNHLYHVFRKLGIRSRRELIGYALRAGIV
jgi:DNA-binding CsgD family transcriptional regulator